MIVYGQFVSFFSAINQLLTYVIIYYVSFYL